ncbi:hypothetical protein E3N88_42577 [Mikania micrantha]|uniref:KANL3/Tex30 alpha/beta hydrolase-like domain-containing protein n=1 Tax=Mikania micrantha TaxID=192012 RepID=A0A5N6LI84_9ASTR|nr:hypothetical protein E3N88_42577 [Mikania micrantha]
MTSNCSRMAESDREQVVVQQYDPILESAETSSVKCSNSNSPVVVFAHGSGASSTSEWMIRWRNLLANALNAVEVVTFDYPYINGGRKAAPKAKELVGFHSDVVRKVAAKYPEHPLILAGKSMGSRISCLVAAENDIEASAVVCLGYSLRIYDRTCKMEMNQMLLLWVDIDTIDDVAGHKWSHSRWTSLATYSSHNVCTGGGNDRFCPLKSLEAIRIKLKVVNALHVIEHGDHSFQISKKKLQLAGMTHRKAEEFAVKAVAVFVSQITNEENTTSLPLRACPKGALPQHVSRMEACVEDGAAAEQNGQPIEPQPMIEEFRITKQKQSRLKIKKFQREKTNTTNLEHKEEEI